MCNVGSVIWGCKLFAQTDISICFCTRPFTLIESVHIVESAQEMEFSCTKPPGVLLNHCLKFNRVRAKC